MKPFSNSHTYPIVVSSKNPFKTLLLIEVALFLVLCLLQVGSYFSMRHTNNLAEVKPAATHKVRTDNANPTAHYTPVAVNTTVSILSDHKKSPSPHAATTSIGYPQKKFLQQNKKRNDSIIKYLGGITEMQEFYFSKNSSHLNHQKAMAKLDKVIRQCKESPETWSRIVILGFTDNVGSKYNNVKLGLKRASYLKKLLVSKGLPAENITIASFGSDLPISDNKTEAGRKSNRRVEFNLIGNS